MKRAWWLMAGMMVLLLGGWSMARVNIHVDVQLPVFNFEREPSMVVIPSTYVYYVPDCPDDYFYYEGCWWRTYRNGWYQSNYYNGPWAPVCRNYVPMELVQLPPNWRHGYQRNHRIPWRDVRTNWRRWHRERYWDNRYEANDYRPGPAFNRMHCNERPGPAFSRRYCDERPRSESFQHRHNGERGEWGSKHRR